MSRPRRDKPFVCVDTDFPDNERVNDLKDPAGGAGLWLAMLCYTRHILADGRVPKRYAASKWADPKNPARLDDMVRVGLLADRGTHYEVLLYAPRNQTKAQVEEDRRKARERMARVRGNSPLVRPNNTEHQDGVPISVSVSVSSSDSEILRDGAGDPFRIPRSERAMNSGGWIAAYERSVTALLGRPWVFERRQIGDLETCIETWCQDKTRIDGWVARAALEFVQAVLTDKSEIWSDYQPKGLKRWFNKDRPGYIPQKAPDPTRPIDGPPPSLPLSPADNAARAAAALRVLDA